jgi:hypothetical protein
MARQTRHLASGASQSPCKIKLAPACAGGSTEASFGARSRQD